MAYAAVRSLLQTIRDLKDSSRNSVASSTLEALQLAYTRVDSLHRTFLKYDEIISSSKGVIDSEARIRDQVRRFQDVIESDATAQFVSQSGSHGPLSLNLDHLRQDIICFAETAKKMEDQYVQELNKPCGCLKEECDYHHHHHHHHHPHHHDAAADSMVGVSDQFHIIRDEFIRNASRQVAVKVSGMAGIGKTTLARKLFNDSLIRKNFECRAFVRVGRMYDLGNIFQAIISQLNFVMVGTDQHFSYHEYFQTCLKGRKCLVVLDDVWEFDFCRQFINKILPKHEDQSSIRIMIISRETHKYLDDDAGNSFRMRFLNKKESWELLKRKVFGEEECPYQLVKAGTKIAENCEGLPLLIVTVTELLSKAQKNVPEFWKEVADIEKQNSVFDEALDQILKVLSPSYHFLPHYLKMSFLYFGAFPKSYAIRRSKIVNLWSAEGFFDPCSGGNEYEELVSRNLLVARQRSPINDKTKACSLHCGYRHLAKREVENIKFIHILNSCEDASIDSVKTHRCLALYKNVLFAIKEVREAMASVSSTLRSLLCTGPYHQYQVPVCLESRLMRVLDAVTVRFYEFPDEVVKLIQLRYLALTCDANLPPTISKLWNLEYLIVQQHLSIRRSVVSESYVPVEIWDLRILKHLQIMGRNVPDPPPGAVLSQLRKLLDIGVESCTKQLLKSVPKLRKLRIQIDAAQTQTLSCFDHISCLHELKSFQSVIIYPEVLAAPPRLLSFAMSNLEKLSLSGFGYPWEDVSIIAKLPCLKVLKLQCYAFQGEKWETKEKEFSRLEYLCIEDTDLVQWTGRCFFARLRFLSMKNCYQFEVIPLLPFFTCVELIDCNPFAENRAKQMLGSNVTAHYSWT